MRVMGGDLVTIAFDAKTPIGDSSNLTYYQNMYVMEIKGESAPDNMMMITYNISLVTIEFFNDRGHVVTVPSTKQQTGVSLVRDIWNTYFPETPLSQPTEDAPLQDGDQPFHVDLVKPFTAIGQIRDIQYYPQYPTGNVMFFRDRTAQVHAPLQYLYTTPTQQEFFIQKQTWGINYTHLFGGEDSFHAIIDIKSFSRSIMLDPDTYAPSLQKVRAFDHRAGKLGYNIFFNLLQGAGQNHALTNSNRTSAPIDFTNQIDKARWYAICLKSQPQVLCKVPLNTGINITVGKGAYLELLPDWEGRTSDASGLYFVTDLVHEIYRASRNVLGTTTFQGLLYGANCNV